MVSTTKSTIAQAGTGRSKQGSTMIKAISALAVAGFMAAALTVLPGFAPEVEASTSVKSLAKADRLDINAGCSTQSWPNFDSSCLRSAAGKVHEARLVTAIRR